MIPKNIRGLCKNLWISRWNSFLCSVLMSSDPSPQQATRAREQSYPHQGALVLITIFCHQDSIHPAPLFLFLLFYLLFYYYYFLSLFSFSPCSPLYCRCSNNENKTNICLWPNKWTFVPNICLSNIWLCAPEYMALCPFNIWPCAPQYMSKQYMALCPPIYALCPSFCNVVKRYVLSNLDATSHWISAYLKRISTCRLTLKCQATGSILSKVLCEWDLTINRSSFSCNYFLLSLEQELRPTHICYLWIPCREGYSLEFRFGISEIR